MEGMIKKKRRTCWEETFTSTIQTFANAIQTFDEQIIVSKKNSTVLLHTDSTFSFSNINWYIIPIIKLMWFVKFCLANLWRKIRVRRVLLQALLKIKKIRRHFWHLNSYLAVENLSWKERKSHSCLWSKLCLAFSRSFSESKMSAVLLIYGSSLWFLGLP